MFVKVWTLRIIMVTALVKLNQFKDRGQNADADGNFTLVENCRSSYI